MKNLTWIILFLFFTSCYEETKEKKSYLEQNPEFEIDLNKIEEKKFWELFKLESVIELRLSNDFFISSIYRMKIYQDEFYVLDESLGNLIRFDEQGSAVNRIGTIGDGPNELPQIADFSIDENGNIYIASGVAMKISKFSKEGEFQSNIQFEDQMDQVAISNNKIFSSLTYFNRLFKNFGVFDLNGDTLKTFFPYNNEVFPILLKNISGHLTSNYSGNILFNEPASSKIYELNDDLIIKPKFQFLSNSEIWPESERHQLNSYFEKLGTAELTFLGRFYEESESHLVFSLNKKQNGIKTYVIDPRFGYFDKKTKTAFLSEKAEFQIPLKGPLAVEEDILYLYASKFELKKIASINPEWSHLKNYINFESDEIEDYDSPVILKLRIRKI